MMRVQSHVVASCVLLALIACDGAGGGPTYTRDDLLDPETCRQCHGQHYTEWAASMHAYASDDPVFIAMNARGQDDTDGELGDFCVNCHAPMAVREGAFENGDFTDFEQVPDHLEGVTCYFCHNVVDIERDHNNGLVLANDTTMRANVDNPVEPWAHSVGSSEYYDSTSPESSRMCGSCHDIVNDNGVHLERTYQEWKNTIFATSSDPNLLQSCSACHMDVTDSRDTIADYPGVGPRRRHRHLFPAVDIHLGEHPARAAMRAAVEKFALPQSISTFTIEPLFDAPFPRLLVSLETAAGHRQPSGAAQDRRMWLEWTAYDEAGKELDGSGTIEDGEVETGYDDQLVMMRDVLLKQTQEGKVETHLFWEAEEILEPLTTLPEPISPIAGSHVLSVPIEITSLVAGTMPKRIEFRVRMRPIGLDVLQELVDSGYLDESIPGEMPTFTVHSVMTEWSDTSDPSSFRSVVNDEFIDETEYLCLLFPRGGTCD